MPPRQGIGFWSYFRVVNPSKGSQRWRCHKATMSVVKSPLWNSAGNQVQSRTQLLVFMLLDKDATTYDRSAECRYGVISQCVQYAQKAQESYISNACLKDQRQAQGQYISNAERLACGPAGVFSEPTVIVGADVSHGAPGSQAPSMASMTVSMDKLGIHYAAARQIASAWR